MWRQSLGPGWVTMRLFRVRTKFPLQSFHRNMFRRRHFAQKKSLQIGLVWIGQTTSLIKPPFLHSHASVCVCPGVSPWCAHFAGQNSGHRFKKLSWMQHVISSYLIISYHIISYHILSYLIISYHISSCPISLLYLIIYQQHSRDILSYHISYCPSPSSAVPCRACANSCITLSSLRSIADMSPLEPSPVRGGPLDPEANAALELLPRRYLSNRNFAQITNRIK
jgi:hypothetical protein